MVYGKAGTTKKISTTQAKTFDMDNFINDFMFLEVYSRYGVMQQAYSMPSIVMNGEQIISTGKNGAYRVNQGMTEVGRKERTKGE